MRFFVLREPEVRHKDAVGRLQSARRGKTKACNDLELLLSAKPRVHRVCGRARGERRGLREGLSRLKLHCLRLTKMNQAQDSLG